MPSSRASAISELLSIVKVTSPADSSVTGGHLCIKGRFGFTFVGERRRG